MTTTKETTYVLRLSEDEFNLISNSVTVALNTQGEISSRRRALQVMRDHFELVSEDKT